MWGDKSEAMDPIIWLYQTVDAQKGEDFLTRSYKSPETFVLKQNTTQNRIFQNESAFDRYFFFING